MSDEHAAAPDHAATLRAWRERGADQLDPVRFGFIEGLIRRAAVQSGAARRLLDEKIARLMAGYEEAAARSPAPASAPARAPAPAPSQALASTTARATAPVPDRAPARAAARASALSSARVAAHSPAPAPARPATPRGPLGTLADLISQRAPTPAADTANARLAPSSPPELKALDDVRSIWARLDAEQRLEQALAQVPANAGPLNSYQLVLRTLMLMREASPDYLQRFMAHVDALMWLERTAP